MKAIFTMRERLGAGVIPILILLASAACQDDPTHSGPDDPALLAVIPEGGATGIDPNNPIVLRFSHPMMSGMEEYADLHEGHAEGPVVPGAWSWHNGMTELKFEPATPLKVQTQYVIHVGGGMRDSDGHHLDFQTHGFGMGGHWFTEDMHQDGHHGQGTWSGGMGGMGGGSGMGGDGWVHPENGGYGMIFLFTTG